MSFTILGLGTARPTASIDQADATVEAAERCCQSPQQERLLRAVYRQSTVRRRGSVLLERTNHDAPPEAVDAAVLPARPFYAVPTPEAAHGPTIHQRMTAYTEHVLPLAAAAARAALAEAGTPAQRITQLVTVSCTGFAAPGVDVRLIQALGLSPGVGRTMIGFMGCHGAINGLRVAKALGESQPGGRVLLCAVELCSLHFQYGWDTQKVVANALFADGAAAAVGAAGDGDAPGGAWRVLDTGSWLLPDSQAEMTWTIGDHGFEMTLSPRVPSLIEAHLPGWLPGWLRERGLSVGDVGAWAIHPGGPKIVDAVERCLGLPAEATRVSREVLAECGNMSSPTVLFIVDRLRRAGVKGPCVALAFGPGLMAEVALLG